MMPIGYKYFTVPELMCKCGCELWDMDLEYMDKLIRMRHELAFPFVLTSAFRCPSYNNRMSKTGLTGPHTTGRAVDVRVYGNRAYQLIGNAVKYGMTGLGVSQSGRDRFIHLDDLTVQDGFPRPWPWSYT